MSPELKKRLPLIAAVIVVVALVVGGTIWWLNGQRWESTDNAFVQADTTLVSPQLSGRVTEVLVGDNQRVEAGQILVKLDDSDQKAQLAQAEANLAAAVAAFEGCPLRGMGATQSVFARGNPNAPVLIVGEGPGADEDRIGQPFVGKAGRLLDRMLAAAGLTDRVFITNTVFWRPPGNRTPTPQEQAVCAPFVERAFALLKPRAVLLLGAASARGVLQAEEGIMKLRGRWQEWRLAEGGVSAPVIPTLHPAFLLRQPQAKRQVWADLLSLAVRLETDSVEEQG
ncbi:uracil-DNA glycosylase [Brevundimonas sp. UBA875]|uniref:uracil-DNA glycosylase n=1 Tax=Brevundimonas sp. UBA875 TaxID=1946143 RepID=UPI0025C4868A|nr:uracil-DNA glycosylase family protein [Brevundimonas sp. UBA875]